MTRYAFIGLGNMGGPMAVNLSKAREGVVAFDLSEAARARVQAQGCATAGDLEAVARDAEVIVSMLPAGRHVRDVYETVRGCAAPGAVFIDCSTIDVGAARETARLAADAGFAMVDAPVSGGVAAATAAGLTFMVGGDASAFERAHPVLETMGKAVIHAGRPGAGQAAKICNNMLLGISMIGTCEAFVLAEKLGLEADRFFEIASKASGQCWSVTSYCPVPGPVPAAPSNRDYVPGFAAAMMLKDLRLAQDAAQSSGAVTPLGAQAQAIYALFDAMGGGAVDFSGIIKMLSGEWGLETDS
ncbi:MAG: 3-hydroxyisobutyrate dehydrogenase [Maricaulaceae bacterium]